MSPDPDLDEAIMVFVVGAFLSLFLFVPVLIIATAMARQIYENLISFALLGPIVISAIIVGFSGFQFGGFIASSAVVSSAVFYTLASRDNPIDDIVVL